MNQKIDLLDHGYVSLVETWGSDERIIEAARMSTSKGFLGWGAACVDCEGRGESEQRSGDGYNFDVYPCPTCKGVGATVGDEKLLRYLYENKHATPFEFAGMVIEVQAPIFVFREWMRHRTFAYNEMSARYAPLPDLNYIPTVERLMLGGGHLTKQAGTIAGAEALTRENAERFRKALAASYAESQTLYEQALSVGVPKELARVHLPVGRYSRMRASANLRNWLAFLTLRDSLQAQREIREYAHAVSAMVHDSFPRTWELYVAERRGADET